MKIGRLIAVMSFVLFAASFYPPNLWPISGTAASSLVIGVREANAAPSEIGIPGYLCAYATLFAPWGADGLRMLHQDPVNYFAILMSGWINPLLLITFVLLLINPNSRLGGILRIVVVLMFAACWVVFYKEHLHPRPGYFLWTAAMLLALFAGKLFPGRRTPVHIG